MPDLTIISWNIHRGRGEDGVIDPLRTVDVFAREVFAPPTDLVVLQEADEERPPHRGILDLADVEARTGLRHIHRDGQSRWGQESHGFLGVLILAGDAIDVECVTVIDLPGHCHRGAVIADLRKNGRKLRLVGMHLSLTQLLRIAQMRTLAQYLYRTPARPTVLCGDLNEWRPWGGAAFSRAVLGDSFKGPALATFPVRRPILPLDRFVAGGGARVVRTRVLDGEGIRTTSDHRPLQAEIEVQASV